MIYTPWFPWFDKALYTYWCSVDGAHGML